MIRKKPFGRLVREISHDIHPDLRWQASALEGLQEAAEWWLTTMFAGVNLLAIHAKRVTIKNDDVKLYYRIGQDFAPPEALAHSMYFHSSTVDKLS